MTNDEWINSFAAPYLTALRVAIPNTPKNDQQFHEDAERLMRALVTAVLIHDDEWHPRYVIDLLSGIKAGYGCWLQAFDEAVSRMDLSFAEEPEATRDRLITAGLIARPLLFHLAIDDARP